MVDTRARRLGFLSSIALVALWSPCANAQDMTPVELSSPDVACASGPQLVVRASGPTGPVLLAGPQFPSAIPEFPMMTLSGRLALTEKQGDEIFRILHNASPVLRRDGKTLRKIQQRLKDLSLSPGYSPIEAAAITHALGAATEQSARRRVDIEHQIAAVLTPDQRRRIAGARRGAIIDSLPTGCPVGRSPPSDARP